VRAFRNRFGDVISRQLDLFAEQHRDLIDECQRALRRYSEADREEAGEHYERFGDLQEEVMETLQELRDRYAATLDERTVDRYASEFDREAARRFRGIWIAYGD
jgi:DNA anti-recombination protein RmuC